MKTSKPLVIAVRPDLMPEAWVGELIAKGHTVLVPGNYSTRDLWQADLILSPQACRWQPGMQAHLDALIKGARAVRFPSSGGRKPTKEAATVPPNEVIV